jgi:anti-sigma B factor antagonist
MNAPFEVSVLNREGRTIVVVSGEMDLTTESRFRDALRTAQRGSAEVIVDLSRVTFIDTRGLSVLVGARRMASDGQFHVVGATRQIRRVFEITGVGHFLSEDGSETTLYRSLDDAIRALDGSRTSTL